VLELGAGTGYISILCAKHLKASHVLATDGSDDVVASLATNFYLNGLEDHPKIEGKELKWGQALLGSEHPEWNAGRNVDVVLGADVTYDGSGIVSLLSTCGDLFELFPRLQIIISATVRNKDTLNKFLDGCQKARYMVDKLDFPMTPSHAQQGPFYSDTVPIVLYQIARV
jgi:predicted nicotinamide N-methyase